MDKDVRARKMIFFFSCCSPILSDLKWNILIKFICMHVHVKRNFPDFDYIELNEINYTRTCSI